ncbi:adenine-specific DNA-methyltransferase [Pedobacter sp. CG_S7]|uniref:site-specific DNA-methyltransferase n=1 Tax=Pedobacter sp. CG_S7 TaxID=3143930 RepID=UPI003398D6C1
MTKKQKLELTWIGKGDEPKLEPRILIENPEFSYGDQNSENMLIHGDNLLALKALEQDYAGKVKCIYIDPPYNTGNAFEHYDDGVEHSLWLSLMSHRLKLLKNLLTTDGTIFVQIDDEEAAYLKVLMDDVFGRQNFINTISVNMKNIAGASGGGEDKRLKKNIEYVHIYAKEYEKLSPFKGVYDYVPVAELVSKYREEGKSWKYTSILYYEGIKKYVCSTVDGDQNEIKIYVRENPIFKTINQIINDENISEKDAYFKYANQIFEAKDAQSSIRQRIIDARDTFSIHDDLLSIEYVPKTGKNKGTIYEQFYKGPQCRLFAWLRDVGETIDGVLYKKNRLGTYWDATSTINNLTKEGGVQFPNGKKPESLISRVLNMATSPGDLVLDSFLGSGTTAAAAHKMERKYIGIEMGNQSFTHCNVRLKKVIDGVDEGGITKAVKWKGGGGFKFYTLAPSLLNKDKFGNWVISKDYNPTMLAAAMAKQEGFTYQPNEHKYWQQGNSSENDFIFTSTQFLTVEALDSIATEMQEGQSLLICCKAFQKECKSKFVNVTIKKIPQMLLNRCEFNKDDYSLNIVNLPKEEQEENAQENDLENISSVQEIRDNHRDNTPQTSLF